MKSLLCASAVLMMLAASATASRDYVVEAYFVVEPQVVENYQAFGYSEAKALTTINQDIDYFLHEINKFFLSIGDYGLNLEVRAKKIDVLPSTDPLFEDCILVHGNQLQSDMALETFKEWLSNNNAHSSIGYDIAIVWTGYDLFSTAGDTSVAGYASVSATCRDPSGVAIAEFDGTYATAVTTAHEIAHSLGASHESYNPSSPCSSHYGFIMNPSSSVTNENRWSFSSCTANDITEYIATLDATSNNCLINTASPASTFDMTSMADADVLVPAKICQRTRNDVNTYFGHFDSFYSTAKGDEVCQKLMCCPKQSFSCSSAMPSDGMICDNNKRCEKGKCVTSSISTGDIDTDCVYGDIDSDNVQGVAGQSCSAYIGGDNAKCYTDWIGRERCCGTCGPKKTGIPDCEYGDKNPDCSNFQPHQICGGYSHICCELCHNYVGKRSVRGNGQVSLKDETNNDQGPPPTPTSEDDDKKNKNTEPPVTA